jgi:hypothetical protein
LIWGSQTLTKCHCKIKNTNTKKEQSLHFFYLAVTFCQRLTAPNQKEQSLYWCSLSCSDILSTFDSPKSKGTELNTNTSSVPCDLGLSNVDKMSLQDKENTSSVPFDLGLSDVDKMSLQDKENTKIKRNRACIFFILQ